MLYKAKVSEVLTREHGENRWVIVNSETGDVLDNNKGDGYVTEEKAITKYELRTFGKTSKSKNIRAAKRQKARKQFLENERAAVEEVFDDMI